MPHDLSENLLHRQHLMAHAANLDSNLQNYRLLLATVGAGVLLALLALEVAAAHPLVQLVGALIVYALYVRAGRGFREAIAYRQHDVDWAHVELLTHEQSLPARLRAFTQFKVYQDRDSASLGMKKATLLSDEKRASPEDVQRYFGSHVSQSRSKAGRLLLTLDGAIHLTAFVVAAVAVFS